MIHISDSKFRELAEVVRGELFTDNLYTSIYATDASAYRQKPMAVLVAKSEDDILRAIEFARKYGISIVPRTAGTSIAGQVVGEGLIVDVSKHMNRILEINKKEKYVRVQPGVVLDELNIALKPYGLFFGPETSTSNRCMIGGMVGNNSCGAHSLIYGSTREHTLEIKAYLSDGSEVVFKELSENEFENKCHLKNLEGDIYRYLRDVLSDSKTRENIKREFPDDQVKRRNTGYAIDILSQMKPFNPQGDLFNMCSLLCGSEGTLAFMTEIKLNLVDIPPANKGLLVVHLKSVEEALNANLVALSNNPAAVELIDKFLLDCTKESAEHRNTRRFLVGDPGALLCVEFLEDSPEKITVKTEKLINDLLKNGYGYAFPLLFGKEIEKVWALRKAGLGLLSNIPGDAKPQPVIEDTAISPEKLPAYIDEFNQVLRRNNLSCVYYAHIATGELHLRPVLNLKDDNGVKLFRLVASEIARLVKKYGGSLSGEHGDGRLRGEFIPYMIGEDNYNVLKGIKNTWDSEHVFNSGKIIETPPMDSHLRYVAGQLTPEFETMFDFSDSHGYVRLAEKCNGSADCRKSSVIGGVMCPSYQATKDERNTTRARANMLREVINSRPEEPFASKELFEILDLCLSCKGCKSECPSGVDMAKLKSEYLYQHYKSHHPSIRAWLIASFSRIQKLAVSVSALYNFFVTTPIISDSIKLLIGFSRKRSLPKVNPITFNKWLKKNLNNHNSAIEKKVGELVLFVDEFTNFNELRLGISAVRLLNKLGYKIDVITNQESGRSKISKGFLEEAQKLADSNVEQFYPIVSETKPLVGIEPSAILSFRDEYPDLLRGEKKKKAVELAKNTMTIEEFIYNEYKKSKIKSDSFTDEHLHIKFHGHCQQKVIAGTEPVKSILKIPINYEVEEIDSGCCGMAGSFGYEKEHYNLSMKIGELKLFPSVRKMPATEIICASGTSCRHHIKDGTGKIALHPVEVLFNALRTE